MLRAKIFPGRVTGEDHADPRADEVNIELTYVGVRDCAFMFEAGTSREAMADKVAELVRRAVLEAPEG